MCNAIRTSILFALFFTASFTSTFSAAAIQQNKGMNPIHAPAPPAGNLNVAGNYTPAPSWAVEFAYVTFYPNGRIMTNEHQIGTWQRLNNSSFFTIRLSGQTHNLAFEPGRGFADSVTGKLTLTLR
jgi:hypothetical protein